MRNNVSIEQMPSRGDLLKAYKANLDMTKYISWYAMLGNHQETAEAFESTLKIQSVEYGLRLGLNYKQMREVRDDDIPLSQYLQLVKHGLVWESAVAELQQAKSNSTVVVTHYVILREAFSHDEAISLSDSAQQRYAWHESTCKLFVRAGLHGVSADQIITLTSDDMFRAHWEWLVQSIIRKVVSFEELKSVVAAGGNPYLYSRICERKKSSIELSFDEMVFMSLLEHEDQIQYKKLRRTMNQVEAQKELSAYSS